jgi:hypothetical protein
VTVAHKALGMSASSEYSKAIRSGNFMAGRNNCKVLPNPLQRSGGIFTPDIGRERDGLIVILIFSLALIVSCPLF